MAPPLTTPVWVIEENIPNGERLELVDADVPHGFPRSKAIFTRGRKVEIAGGGIYNPGSSVPVAQVKSTRDEPLVLTGAFRDHHSGTPGHARAMSDALDNLCKRRNPLVIRWSPPIAGTDDVSVYEWQGILEECSFPVEGPSDILYELKFFVAVGPLGKQASTRLNRAAPVDQISQRMAASVAEQKATQLALKIKAATALVLASVWDTAESACNTLTEVAATLDQLPSTEALVRYVPGDAGGIYAAAKRVDDQAARAQRALQAVRFELETTSDSEAMVSTRESDVVVWRASRSSTITLLDQWINEARTIRQQALGRIQTTARVVRAGPDDTLPGLAQRHLGSAARAADLGIQSTKLKAGTQVRVPPV